jgi:hypothetical protein
MGHQHLKPTLLLLATVLWANFATAQTTAPYLKEVLILNGGQYGNPQQNITLIGYDPFTGQTRISDTINSQSIQDLLIEGDFAYIAAEDSLVKIRLSDFSRVAGAKFPGASTYTMALYQNQLLVGNWYGQSDSNLYVFNKNTLVLDYAVPQIEQGVKGIVIIGDTAYLAQNLTASDFFSDSAGYIAKLHLPSGTFAGNVPGDNVSDIGKILEYDGGVLGIGSVADVASFYDLTDGSLNFFPLGVDVNGGYGSILQLVGDTLLAIIDGSIGSFDLLNGTVINPNIVDTLITAFRYDTLSGNYYVTQTDYFSYTRGIVFNSAGVAIDTFLTGFSPEAMSLVYGINNAPVGVDDFSNAMGGSALSVFPLDNDTDADGDSLILSIVNTTQQGISVLNGAEIVYTANAGYMGYDTLVYQVCDYSPASLCSQAQIVFLVTVVGISETDTYQVTVFPNPTTDRLSIRLTGNEVQTLHLRDLTGRTLATAIAEPNTLTNLDMGTLAPGLYLLQSADGRFTQKVVKE